LQVFLKTEVMPTARKVGVSATKHARWYCQSKCSTYCAISAAFDAAAAARFNVYLGQILGDFRSVLL
jgi:hypothetical protein